MKKLLPALVLALAACSSQPTQTPQQAAITAYLQKTLDDPASYQPVSWGQPVVWRVSDQARMPIDELRLELFSDSVNTEHAKLREETRRKYAGALNTGPELLNQAKRAHAKAARAEDSVRACIQKVLSVTDTTRLGYLITHVFRAKNKMGALVLDSARFEVLNDGKVRIWDTFRKN